jgi:hypothetical protein
MFSSEFPGLCSSTPEDVREPALPELRNLVIVDNKGEARKHELKSAIDWREIMIWREDTKEGWLHKEISSSLHKDDIINLQFTRFVFLPICHATPCLNSSPCEVALQVLPRPYRYCYFLTCNLAWP